MGGSIVRNPRHTYRLFGSAVLALTISVASMPVRARGTNTGGVYAGSCGFTLTVTYTPAANRLPGAAWATFSGPATLCVVNGELVSGHFSGVLAPVLGVVGSGCAAGALSGRGTFDTSALGFPDPDVAVEIVNTGGVVTMDVNAEIYVFRGVGTFVQPPAHTSSCLGGASITTTTWTGTVTFEDPKPPI